MLAVIHSDAVNVPLLDRLASEGRLPAYAGLRAAGEWTPLQSAARHLEGSGATTLHSGTRPGEHGIYHPFGWSPEHQRLRLRRPEWVPEAVWNRVGRAGRRSLVIDPYDSVRAREVDGVAICGWQATNRVTLPRWSSPAPVARDLAKRFGKPADANETFGGARLSELLRLRRVLLDAPRRLAAAAQELLRRERFDLVWVELVAPHLAGHQFWDAGRVVDLTDASAEQRRALDTTVADVYEASDRALGAVLDALPDDADVILVAASGMAAETDRSDLLPGMLAAILDDRAPGHDSPGASGGALWSVRAALPVSVRTAIARLIPDRAALGLTAWLSSAGMNWRRTRAFVLPNEPFGAIRLNLRGRERDGIVEPDEVDALVDEIEAGLLTFRDPGAGSAVESIVRVRDEESGPRAQLLPDLCVRWSSRPSNGLRYLESPEFGEIERPGLGTCRSGNHAGDGWAVLAPRRSRARDPGRPPELVDVAATACALLGADDDLAALPGEPLLV